MGAEDNKTTIDPELQELQKQERARIAAEAAAAKAQRTNLDNQEITDLTDAQTAQTQALKDNNETLYKNQAAIIEAVQAKRNAAILKDETARKRENAFRYISGLGDTLSGVANLIGTAHGASNQNQKYNSHAVVQKAEEARKARKLDIESQSKRLDELSAQLQNLKAAGSLKEAELAAAQMKEKAALKKGQRTAAEAEDKYYSTRGDQAVQAATSQFNANRTFNAQQAQTKQAQENWQKTYNMQYAKFKDEQNAKNYNFALADGSIDIPKEKINEANIERIYQMLPEEIRKTVKGEQFIEYGTDEYGTQTRTTAHKAPSLTQKLAAIASYADKDNAIKNELRALAGMKKTQSTPAQTPPSSSEDSNPYLNPLGTLSYNPNNPGPVGSQKKTITGW